MDFIRVIRMGFSIQKYSIILGHAGSEEFPGPFEVLRTSHGGRSARPPRPWACICAAARGPFEVLRTSHGGRSARPPRPWACICAAVRGPFEVLRTSHGGRSAKLGKASRDRFRRSRRQLALPSQKTKKQTGMQASLSVFLFSEALPFSRSISLTDPRKPCRVLPRRGPSRAPCHEWHPGRAL